MIYVELWLWFEVIMFALGVVRGPVSVESTRKVLAHPHSFRLVRLLFFTAVLFMALTVHGAAH